MVRTSWHGLTSLRPLTIILVAADRCYIAADERVFAFTKAAPWTAIGAPTGTAR